MLPDTCVKLSIKQLSGGSPPHTVRVVQTTELDIQDFI